MILNKELISIFNNLGTLSYIIIFLASPIIMSKGFRRKKLWYFSGIKAIGYIIGVSQKPICRKTLQICCISRNLRFKDDNKNELPNVNNINSIKIRGKISINSVGFTLVMSMNIEKTTRFNIKPIKVVMFDAKTIMVLGK